MSTHKNTTPKISATKNYRLFERSVENRMLDMRKHRSLEKSMRDYGFLKCFPIICYRGPNKQLIVKDGQHRLAIAETLGLQVYYIDTEEEFDVAVINSTAKIWAVRDYAEKFAANGNEEYAACLKFADMHGIPIGTAFAILGGSVNFSNVSAKVTSGEFTINDQKWADAVAALYGPMVGISSKLRNSRFLSACMAVCRVDDFDHRRMLQNAERCRDKLVSYSNREAYLDMLEEVYNYGRKSLVGLRAASVEALRARNAALKTSGK
jgi:hypothetical protein